MPRLVLISNHQQEANILHTAFTQRGFQVFIAKASSDNYLQMLQFRPDIALLEISTGYQDQIALLRLLRKNERFRKTPVVAYGSNGSHTMILDLKNEGCSQFLLRPIKLAPLLEAMQQSAPELQMNSENAELEKTRDQEKKDELDRLLDSSVKASLKLDLMVKYTGKLMSFPFTVTKVLQITENESSGAEDLARTINGDPSLCATILKVANSALFASTKEIRNAKEAIMRLGFNEVRTLAIGLKVMELFPEKDTFGFQRMDFWSYSLGRAMISEKIARHVRLGDPAIAFLSGLLADMSVLLFDAFFPQVFSTVLRQVAADGKSFEACSKEVLGFHPIELVVELLKHWRLPNQIVQALTLQPDLFGQEEDPSPDAERKLADCVALSQVLVRAGDIGHGCDDTIVLAPDGFLREVGLPAGLSGAFYDSVLVGLKTYAGFFALDPKLLPAPTDPATLPNALYIRTAKRLLDPYHLFLSRTFQCFVVRSLPELEKLLSVHEFRMAVLEVVPGTSGEDVKRLLERLVPVQSDQGKALPLLGIFPGDPPPAPAGLSLTSLNQHTDLRKLSQIVETMLV